MTSSHPTKNDARRVHLPLWLSLLLLPIAWIGSGVRSAGQTPAVPGAQSFEGQVLPVLRQYCDGCHKSPHPSGGLDLSAARSLADLQSNPAEWTQVVTRLREDTMPPPGMPQPNAETRAHLSAWIADALNPADAAPAPPNPGRVLIHRLSRLEYNNSIRDLFGVDTHPADRFPADGGGGGGFDNNADTLFIPPILMERYLSAANEILETAKPDRIFFVQPGRYLPPKAAARKIVAAFAMKGYRRPVQPAEVDRLMSLYALAIHKGRTYETAVKFALKAILVSPYFLFRVEGNQPGKVHPLNDYELASRLSYFLWSSMPDEMLFRAAAQGRLHNPAVLQAQVQRMLKDPKSRALAENFAGQWLRIRELYTTALPDPGRFPNYTPAIRDAMTQETYDFFYHVIESDESLLHLLDADYTYLNEDLAKLYGIEGVKGPEMRPVVLKDRRRGGLLTMGSVLTVTSYPQRTSPVLRGKWVMETILGATIPPPPPDAGGLPVDDAPQAGQTFRQRLEQHRSKPQCASCHSRMDPIGFGLENFDGIGQWRAAIGGTAVDASGVLTTGEKFDGPVELKALLMKSKKEFIRNLTEKMLAYALGRGVEPYDAPAVQKIAGTVTQGGYRSDALIQAIATSYPFLYKNDG